MAIQSENISNKIRENLDQANQMLKNGGSASALGYQAITHAIALAFYNAVQQQQQMYILQNAILTAAVKESLKSNPAEAIKLAKEAAANNDVAKTISQLSTLMDEISETYSDLVREDIDAKPPARPRRKKAKPMARKKAPAKAK